MLTELANSLSASKIRYCVLHGWQSLPESLFSDLDMVVHHADLRALERILRNHSEGRLVQLLQHESSCFYFVLAIRQDGDIHFILVDVATDYRRDRRIFFTAEELLADRHQRNEFWVASPRVEYGYLLIKKVAKGAMPEHQKNRLGELCQELGNEAGPSAYYLFGKKYGDFITSCISTANWNAFESNLSRLRRALLWQVVKRNPFNPFLYLVSEVRRVWNRCRFPTGLFVVVLGPDGAGKTTLIDDLRKNLTGGFRRTEAFHLRPMVMGRKGTESPVTDPHGKWPHPLWLSLLKIPYYLLDYGLGYFFKVRPRLVRSTLVLFDRYYDDLLVDPRRYRYGGPHWLARLIRHFVPRPDLTLVIDVAEEELLARKQEVSHKELTRQREAYRNLAREDSNAILLEGSLTPEEVARNAGEAILDYLHMRYLKRRHFWFRDDGSETLSWLTAVLISSPEKARFVLSNSKPDDPKAQWRTTGSFGWLSLKDGRGYLIPMDSRQTRIKALSIYNAQNLKARVAKKLLTIGLNGHLCWPVLHKVQILVREDMAECERTKTSLLEYLKDLLGRQDLTFAISLSTPGRHRKPVIQALTHAGEILAYVKVGWNEATNTLVRNETEVLKNLAASSLHSFTPPHLIHSGLWNGRFLCVQAGADGRIQAAPRDMTPQYLSAVQELALQHTELMPLKDSPFWIKLLERIQKVRSKRSTHILRHGVRVVEDWLSNTRLPFHLCHGDFTPWNAKLDNGRLLLFDWEYADLKSPPGWDLFHFIVQTLWLLQKRTPGEIHKLVLNDSIHNESIRTYLESLNIKKSHLRALYLVYVLDRLAFFVSDHDADQGRRRYFANMSSLIMFDGKCSQQLNV